MFSTKTTLLSLSTQTPLNLDKEKIRVWLIVHPFTTLTLSYFRYDGVERWSQFLNFVHGLI